jgi:riboflavin synthase
MFTGIIETTGLLETLERKGSNIVFRIRSEISDQLKPDQSLAHDGVCLTVEQVEGNLHSVTAVEETLSKTCLGSWQPGRRINLERALMLGGRLDGHLVQGHVDATGTCLSRENRDGSWLFRFSYPPAFAALIIEKGSVCMNGISLTAFNVDRDGFSVAVIPYTFSHTNISDTHPGDRVNIEFDMMGKYVARSRDINS